MPNNHESRYLNGVEYPFQAQLDSVAALLEKERLRIPKIFPLGSLSPKLQSLNPKIRALLSARAAGD